MKLEDRRYLIDATLREIGNFQFFVAPRRGIKIAEEKGDGPAWKLITLTKFGEKLVIWKLDLVEYRT